MVSVKHPNDPTNETRLTLKVSMPDLWKLLQDVQPGREESPLIRITKKLVLEGGGAEGERAVDV